MRILIVEDDERMAAALKQGLQEDNHTVTTAGDGDEGLHTALTHDFDVVVLDVMLPGMNGFDVARRLRRNGRMMPILMLTARDATRDIVEGLDAGADDYLNKPFAFEELLARLRSLGRRGAATQAIPLVVADLRLDPATHEVTRAGRTLHLTPTEFRLLEALMRANGRVLARAVLVNAVWGIDRDIEPNTLDAFVRLLRKKVDEPFPAKLVHTVPTVGYCLRERE